MGTAVLSTRLDIDVIETINEIAYELSIDFRRKVTRHEVVRAALDMFVADCNGTQDDVRQLIYRR